MSLFASEPTRDEAVFDLHTPPPVPRWWPWVWMTATCTLLGASGLVRLWQDARFDTSPVVVATPSFDLTTLPSEIGTWIERGESSTLDPKVARIAGSSASLIRSYVDTNTGVRLDVLLAYGPAALLSSHRPEVCYPSVGYSQAESPIDQVVPLFSKKALNPDAETALAVVRSMWYARWGKALERQEVFYTYRRNNRWSPNVDGNWKTLTHSPALYKLQIQRRIAEQERRFVATSASQGKSVISPTLRFLSVFLPEIESRIASAATPGGSDTLPRNAESQ